MELLTDRAKRYRANAAIAQQDRRCIYCGRSGGLQHEHISGDESDLEPANLAYACRACNARKGAVFARAGAGVRTRQYNPAAAGARSLGAWTQAVLALHGQPSSMSLADAIDLVRATPADRRSQFAAEIWRRRREHGTDRLVPF